MTDTESRCIRCLEEGYTRHGYCAGCAILLAFNPHHPDVKRQQETAHALERD